MSIDKRSGILSSAARLGISLTSLMESKVLLFANEFETERVWLIRMALRLLVAVAALALACSFAGAWLVYLLWDWNHTLALLAPALLFLALGFAAWNSMLALAESKPAAFGETCEELRRDRAALTAFFAPGHD